MRIEDLILFKFYVQNIWLKIMVVQYTHVICKCSRTIGRVYTSMFGEESILFSCEMVAVKPVSLN